MTNKSPGAGTPGQGGGKVNGYTEYGYELDGIEYATVDEAYEAQ